MSERASEPDIEPRRFNVAEVPEADLPLRSFDFTRLGSTERNAEMRVLFGRLIPSLVYPQSERHHCSSRGWGPDNRIPGGLSRPTEEAALPRIPSWGHWQSFWLP